LSEVKQQAPRAGLGTNGVKMKKLGVFLLATVGFAGFAHAADLLPTTKAPPVAPSNCYASVWTWLDSTAADCPLSWGPFTVYATLDGGLTYESNGAPYNARWNNGVDSFIQKQSYGPKWLWSPNNLSQSVAGIKMSQPLPFLSGPFLSGWSLVGTWEWGFNPYYGFPAAAQQSQVNQNGRALLLQGAGADSSRTGQPDNSQAFIGISNKTYGTLTAGRVNTLSLDAINSYDPMGGSYAFSPLGFSGSFAGFGDTEAARANTAVKYRLDLPTNLFGLSGANFRVGGLAQWGGYDQGNGTNGLYQGQVGGDFNLFGGTPWAGTLSMDGIGSWAKDAVNLSTFTGTCATLTKGPFVGQTGCTTGLPIAPGFQGSFYSNTDFKATLSNNTGFLFTAKYKWQAWTIYGGYAWLRQADPSDTFPDGFRTIGGWNVPATIPSTFPGASKFWPTQWISSTTYAVPRIAPYFWVGAKYAVTPQLDVTGAFYYLQQSDYATTVCAGALAAFVQPNGNKITVARTNSGSCAGTEDFFSALIDYRPFKRVDLYAGLMVSNVYGGLANGFPATQDISPTAGIRIKF
jgi:predicted porin